MYVSIEEPWASSIVRSVITLLTISVERVEIFSEEEEEVAEGLRFGWWHLFLSFPRRWFVALVVERCDDEEISIFLS